MSPTDIPTSQPASAGPTHVVIDESTVETARKLERAKTLVKKTFMKVGVPVLIGSAAAYVATRNKDQQDEQDSESNDDTATEE